MAASHLTASDPTASHRPTAASGVPDHGHDALAADGAIVRIRPVTGADRAALAELYERTSDENLYRRFLSGGRAGIGPELDRLTRPVDADHLAVRAQARDRILG